MGPLMKVADSLAKNILVWLEITTTASAIEAKKRYMLQEQQP